MVISETMQYSKSVCVIGAGPAGLAAARELRREGHKVVVFEQNHDIGGQWLYEPNVQGEDPMGKNPVLVHSSIYESLRLMSPREIMGFTDFPFLAKKGRDLRRFPGHKELFLYLNDFCEWFGLREVIRFNTKVEYVGPLNYNGAFNGHDLKWIVRSKEKKSDGEVAEQVFDAVVLAIGHYSQPKLPCIQGMDTWKRRQMHSHVYRTPQPFDKEIVVVVGNSYSGQEISMELVKVAKEVHLSSNAAYITEGLSKVINKHQNFHLHPQIDKLQEDGQVIFTDGSSIQADTILYCTGYCYAYPFLDTKGMVVVEDNRVGPLYEHIFPPSLAPSLSFMGLPSKVLSPHFFESQAKWIAQVLSGKKNLPSSEEMMKSVNEFYHSREVANVPKRYTHSIADNDGFEYFDKLGETVGLPKLEEWRKQLCISSTVNMFTNLDTFRDSWTDDEMLKETLKSPYFTQLGDHGFENPL